MAPESSGFVGALLDVVFFRNPMSEPLLYMLMATLIVGTLAAATVLRGKWGEGRLGQYAARVTPSYPYVLMQGGITIAVSLQASIELKFTEWLGWDFTPLVYRFEGRAVETFQSTLSGSAAGPFLDVTLILVYTWGAFLLSMLPFLFLVFTGRVASARRLTFTLMIVWAVGLLFYMFFPVYEVWVTSTAPYNYGNVRNILLENSPALTDATIYRVNLNNNFPSLHTGVASAIVFSLWFAREKMLFRIGAPIAAGIVFATVYLGIHWFVDLVAGLALAWGAAYWVHRRELAREQDAGAVAEPSADPGAAAE